MIASDSSVHQAMQDVHAAIGRAPADLVVFGCRLVNVWSDEVHDADLAIRGGRVVAIRRPFDGAALERIDAGGAYALPAFVDPPAASSLVRPCEDVAEIVAALRSGSAAVIDQEGPRLEALLQDIVARSLCLERICIAPRSSGLARLATAIATGVSPPTAGRMLSLNAAILLGTDHASGSVAPGRRADIMILDALDGRPPSVLIENGLTLSPQPRRWDG